MNDDRSLAEKVSFVSSIIGSFTFFATLIGLAVDIPSLLGWSSTKLAQWGKALIVGSLALALSGPALRVYARWRQRCLWNALRVKCFRFQLTGFQEKHHRTPLNDTVDINDVKQLQRFLKWQHIKYHIRSYELEPSSPGINLPVIRLVIHKPEDVNLLTGMPIAVYLRRRSDPLVPEIILTVDHPGNVNTPSAVLDSRSINVEFPLLPEYGLDGAELSKRSFRVQLIEPEVSKINELLGLLCYVIDCERRLGHFVLDILPWEEIPDWVRRLRGSR